MMSLSSFAGGECAGERAVWRAVFQGCSTPRAAAESAAGVREGGEAFRKISVAAVDKVGRVGGAFKVPPNLCTSHKKLG